MYLYVYVPPNLHVDLCLHVVSQKFPMTQSNFEVVSDYLYLCV